MPEPRPPSFGGFVGPNYTQIPNEIFDELMPTLSGSELKVLLYVARRTFGWGKDGDPISLQQLCHGIIRRDGRPLDGGTGLSRETVIRATHTLEERGILVVERGNSENGDSDTNVYRLRFRDESDAPNIPGIKGVVRKLDHPGERWPENPATGSQEIRPPVAGKSDPQKTCVQNKDSQEEEAPPPQNVDNSADADADADAAPPASLRRLAFDVGRAIRRPTFACDDGAALLAWAAGRNIPLDALPPLVGHALGAYNPPKDERSFWRELELQLLVRRVPRTPTAPERPAHGRVQTILPKAGVPGITRPLQLKGGAP